MGYGRHQISQNIFETVTIGRLAERSSTEGHGSTAERLSALGSAGHLRRVETYPASGGRLTGRRLRYWPFHRPYIDVASPTRHDRAREQEYTGGGLQEGVSGHK